MKSGPLEGRRIVLTRQASKARDSMAAIESLGGTAILLPAISIDRSGSFPDFDAALADITTYDYVVVTSANTAQALVEGLRALGLPMRGPWVCVAIGKATSRALEEAGIAVGAMPDEAVSDRIAACLGDLKGKRVLMPGSDIVRGTAAAEIRSLGAHVDEVVAYRTVAATLDMAALAELDAGVDAVIFTSPSTVRGFDEMTKGRYREEGPARFREVEAPRPGAGGVLVACIGPVTAADAMALGYRVDLVPADHSMEGLIEALVDYWRDASSRAAKGVIA